MHQNKTSKKWCLSLIIILWKLIFILRISWTEVIVHCWKIFETESASQIGNKASNILCWQFRNTEHVSKLWSLTKGGEGNTFGFHSIHLGIQVGIYLLANYHCNKNMCSMIHYTTFGNTGMNQIKLIAFLRITWLKLCFLSPLVCVGVFVELILRSLDEHWT